MFRTLSPLRSAAAFYLLAFAMVVAVAVTGGTTAAAMLTPAVATLLMLLVVTRQGWGRDGWTSPFWACSSRPPSSGFIMSRSRSHPCRRS